MKSNKLCHGTYNAVAISLENCLQIEGHGKRDEQTFATTNPLLWTLKHEYPLDYKLFNYISRGKKLTIFRKLKSSPA